MFLPDLGHRSRVHFLLSSVDILVEFFRGQCFKSDVMFPDYFKSVIIGSPWGGSAMLLFIESWKRSENWWPILNSIEAYSSLSAASSDLSL